MCSLYIRNYYSARKDLDESRHRTISNHRDHYDDLENMLGFQYYLHTELWRFYDGLKHDELFEKYPKDMVTEISFHQNIVHLQASLRSLECDLIHPCMAGLRTIHEAIPKMYYMSLNPGEVWDILESENSRAKNPYFAEFIRKMRGFDRASGAHGAPAGSRGTPRDLYQPSYFRRMLYDGVRRDAIDAMYGVLSLSVHPGAIRNMAGQSYDRRITDMFFRFLKTLSYFNIAAYMEGAAYLLRDMMVAQESLHFLNCMAGRMKTAIGGAYFFPNRGDLASRLRCKVSGG